MLYKLNLRRRKKALKNTQIRNSLLLFLTATIWGTSFVAQSVGMDYIGPITFTFARNITGGLFLIPCIWLMRKLNAKNNEVATENRPLVTKDEWLGGILCGIALCAAGNFQQIGIANTTVGKAGFITALYVVIVPLLGLFFKKRVPRIVWLCVVLSVIGLYLLCMTSGSFSLSYGDFLVFICAIMYSIHILIIDYFSPKGDGVVISCIQFLVCGVLSGIIMLFVEDFSFTSILKAAFPILYAGVLSSGVGHTLQVVGQKGMNPTVASLILCLESVVSVLAGWVILHQALSTRELFGCLLMFVAIVLAQIPMPSKKK